MRTRLLLITLSAFLLTLSFAPFSQFYLAFVALVPWLLAIHRLRTRRSAFALGYLLGVLFFAPNFCWLYTATLPGLIATVLYLSLYPAFLSVFVHATRIVSLPPLRATLAFAAAFTTFEYLRSIIYPHVPWLLLGHSQSPFLPFIQLADITGVAGITFLVAASNALIYLYLTTRSPKRLTRPAVPIAILFVLNFLYGFYRLHEPTLAPGPRVLLVQLSHPHLRGGDGTVSREAAVPLYLDATRRVLASASPPPDLIAWPEGAMPPLNPEALAELRRAPVGPLLQSLHDDLTSLCSTYHTSLVTGGFYVGSWATTGRTHAASDIRNAAYLFTPTGQSPLRYDKISPLPFAESLPSFLPKPLLLMIAAPSATQPDHPGDSSALTAFPLGDHRFVTPICSENVDAPFLRSMLRPDPATGRKRADLILDLTNDGWFSSFQHHQHLQAVLFRAVENRTPIARCSNTGISAFVSSTGRIVAQVPCFTESPLSANPELDSRISPYATLGDAFPIACMIATVAISTFCLRQKSKVE